MNFIDVHKVVKKCLGEIDPIGESNVDAARALNLKEYQGLIEQLVQDVRELDRCRNNHQWSMKNATVESAKFLIELRDSLADVTHPHQEKE